MSSNTEHRKLAAIMFTDMVGYSALAQRDEALALELLEEHRLVVRSILPGHGGREVKTTGDGFLIEFPSALAAVQCAIDVQAALHARNLAQPEEGQARIRIGVHIGDVVVRDGDVHGDGVNLAARIEPLAEPGGICLSRPVHDQVVNKLEAPLAPLSRAELKNIQGLVEVHRVVIRVESTKETVAILGRVRWMPDGKSLVFLGQNEAGVNGIYVQDFLPGKDTTNSRRPFGPFDPEKSAESFGISPDGQSITIATWEQFFSIMMTEDL